jgi:hypothetical protein
MTDLVDFTAGSPDGPWLPVRHAIERTEVALTTARESELRAAVRLVLEQAGQLVDAADRHTDAEWLFHRAQAVAQIVTVLAESLDRPR